MICYFFPSSPIHVLWFFTSFSIAYPLLLSLTTRSVHMIWMPLPLRQRRQHITTRPMLKNHPLLSAIQEYQQAPLARPLSLSLLPWSWSHVASFTVIVYNTLFVPGGGWRPHHHPLSSLTIHHQQQHHYHYHDPIIIVIHILHCSSMVNNGMMRNINNSKLYSNHNLSWLNHTDKAKGKRK